MKQNKLLKNIFTADTIFNDSVSYRRIIVINTALILAMVSFFSFIFINFFYTKNYFVVLLDIFSFITALMTFFQLRKNKNIPRAAVIATSLIIIFILLFILDNKNTHLGIIWTLLPGYFAILINGKRVGLIFTFVFYTIMFYLAYTNIGIWNEAQWNLLDLSRYIFAVILLNSMSYMSESAYEISDKELKLVRKNERKIMKELQNKAITDSMTGLYNRRYFNEKTPKILQTAQRNNAYISFFILDIDYFKNYNDYYGHQAGDEALKKVAQSLQEFIQREDDFVFRIGGEEFAGIVHIKTIQEGEEFLSKLTTHILNLNIEHIQSKLDIKKLTVSVGVCSQLVTQRTDLDYFYKLADKALYRAKESGRNKMLTQQR